MKTVLIPLLMCSVLGACATDRYGFRPATMVASNESGFPASRHPIPQESPQGEVYITSFGTRDIAGPNDSRSQLIHVRLAVSNQSGTSPWTLDPQRQVLVSSGGTPQSPAFLEIDGKNPGDATVAPRQKKVFDLYYHAPSNIAEVPAFDVQWQVSVDGRDVGDRTPFVREPYRDYGQATRSYWAVGIASPWWISWYGAPWYGWYGPWGPGPYWGGPYGYGYGYYGHGYPYGGSRIGVGGGVRGGYSGGGYSGGGRSSGGARIAPSVRGAGRR